MPGFHPPGGPCHCPGSSGGLVQSIVLRRNNMTGRGALGGQSRPSAQDFLHIEEIAAFDSQRNKIPLEAVEMLPLPDRGEPFPFPLERAVNGLRGDFAHAIGDANASMRFAPVGGPKPIQSIVIYNRRDGNLQYRLQKALLEVNLATPQGNAPPLQFGRCTHQREREGCIAYRDSHHCGHLHHGPREETDTHHQRRECRGIHVDLVILIVPLFGEEGPVFGRRGGIVAFSPPLSKGEEPFPRFFLRRGIIHSPCQKKNFAGWVDQGCSCFSLEPCSSRR